MNRFQHIFPATVSVSRPARRFINALMTHTHTHTLTLNTYHIHTPAHTQARCTFDSHLLKLCLTL